MKEVHDFEEKLSESEDQSLEPQWEAFYRGYFPDYHQMVRLKRDGELQKRGVDRLIILQCGKHIYIDEKVIRRWYGHILLEEWSVADYDKESDTLMSGKKVGWALDDSKLCDYVAYCVPERGWCAMIPFQELKTVFRRNIEEWRKEYGNPAVANSPGYQTVCVKVNWDTIVKALQYNMRRRF